MNYDFLINLEKQLLQPELRKNKAALEAILHPDFFEFGSSGKKWDRATIIATLTQEDGVRYNAFDFLAHPISHDAVLVTYVSQLDDQKALRASIWKKSGDVWQLFFHQGTKAE